jgi:4'-phosphopantetheinyl transferase
MKPLPLGPEEIHVWRAPLEQPDAIVRDYWHILSGDEQARSERYSFEKDKRSFIVRRGVLRAIVSRYLGISRSQVRFVYGPHGKPHLEDPESFEGIQFSSASSRGLGLWAFCKNRQIGVDLECIRSAVAYEEIASQFFSTAEREALSQLPDALKLAGFFACWTQKEAYVKARGEGFSLAFSRFEVSAGPGKAAKLISVEGNPQEARRWSLEYLDVGQDYAAALAISNRGLKETRLEFRTDRLAIAPSRVGIRMIQDLIAS